MSSSKGKGLGRPPAGEKAGQSGPAPRRLGGQAQPNRRQGSAGAARRYDRSHQKRPAWMGWAAVGVVVIVVAVLVLVKVTGGTTSTASASDASGRHPAPAPASLVTSLATIPASIFDSVGTDAQPAPFTVTAHQTPLVSKGKPEFIYEGGEFCPYCALMRWSMIAALSRFGTFSGLKLMSSATTDGDIPTFSFVGATYTSKYVTFTPYESEDRLQQPLQTPPSYVDKLYAKYDGNGATPAAPFNPSSSAGIPFLDIGNKYVAAGDPSAMAAIFAQYGVLDNGGPGRAAIVAALRDPSSQVGTTIYAKVFVAQANYISAAICSLDGGKPASVCSSPGVEAASKVLAAAKTVS